MQKSVDIQSLQAGPGSAAAPSLLVEEVTTLSGLQELRCDWWGLWRRCPDSTPFQSPAWLLSWWKHLGQGQLRVLALRLRGRLVGLAPFFIKQCAPDAPRELRLLGTGQSDYLDVLLEPEVREQAQVVLSRALNCSQDATPLSRQAVREKDRMFDFLRGTESYKYFWGAQNTQTWRRRAWRESTTMF